MRLSKLMTHVGGEYPGHDPDISSIHYRSQEVQPGGLFVAIRGQAADGHDFIDDAFSRGGAAVVAERQPRDDKHVALVPDSRLALAQLSAAFYGNPSEHLSLVGITGTNGKTTVSYLVESILAAANHRVGVIGTNNCRYAGRTLESTVTTPESLDLQKMMADMKSKGVSHAVMEVSSHGIDLKRVAACRFDVGAFTNLTQDHLDYHDTMAAYWECKKRFFTDLLPWPRATAVVNTDNAHGRELCQLLESSGNGMGIIGYGGEENNDVRAVDTAIDLSGLRGVIIAPGGSTPFHSGLVGRHNLENILCAAGIAVALGLPLTAIRQGIEALDSVPGRLERVGGEGGKMVFVDYAHTPDALENVLQTLRDVSQGRLLCVFGCGGDRDRRKRPLMGKIAGRFADLAVVTSDNPRTETADAIIADILPGVQEEMGREVSVDGEHGYRVIPDRAEAIREAVRMAGPGDVVLIAGKGHETYQIIGREKRDFDDRKVAADAFRNRTGETRARGQA